MSSAVDNGLSEEQKDSLSALAHIAVGNPLFSIRPSMASALLAYMGSLEMQRTEAKQSLTASESRVANLLQALDVLMKDESGDLDYIKFLVRQNLPGEAL